MVIGVTGKYCSGKSTIARMLEQHDCKVLSVDNIGYQALAHYQTQVVTLFGESILNKDNSINRRILGAIVFSNREKLEQLESLLHPWMRETIINMLAQNPSEKWVLDSALLFPMNLHTLCTHVIIVHAPYLIRLFRARKRDVLTFRQIIQRFKNQTHILEKDSPLSRVSNEKNTLNITYKYSEIMVSGTSSIKKLEDNILPFLRE